jgi:outer membrane biosynthesis protein TonB
MDVAMRAPAKCVVLLLPILLTGCFHRQPQPQPQPVAPELAQTPPPAPVPVTPPPIVTPTPPPAAAPTAETAPPPEEPENPAVHHKKRADKPAPEAASNAETPAVNAIGQLSSGDPETARKDVEDSIAATEYKLKQLTRPLNDQEQKTVAQIKEFLKQAKSALGSGDADGANTLALKAKVLLSELTD